jgi:hypothetical protein
VNRLPGHAAGRPSPRYTFATAYWHFADIINVGILVAFGGIADIDLTPRNVGF